MPLEELLSLGLPGEFTVLIVSALPIFELRGALPMAINLFQFPWHYALPLVIIGNLLPVPIILLSLNPVSRWLSKVGLLERLLHRLFGRTRRQGRIIEKYERIGLVLLVAIPLPFTGAWTGSAAAVLLGLKFKHAFTSIFIGICIAGIIVTCLSLLGWAGAMIAAIVVGSLAISGLWKASR